MLAVRRFSRIAFGSVAVLAATGIYQSWRQLGSWSAFTGTSYGQLLLVKIGLVVVLVGIAWISRRWTARLSQAPATKAVKAAKTSAATPVKATAKTSAKASAKTSAAASAKASAKTSAATSEKSERSERSEDEDREAEDEKESAAAPAGGGDGKRATQLARQRAAVATAREKRVRDADPLRSGLRRSVLAEAGVAVVLLAVTTVLTSTEPGRTVEEAEAATAASSQEATGALAVDIPFDTGGKDGKGLARVEIDPARVGGNDMHVYVQRPNGKAFDIPEVKVSFTLKAKDIGPLPVVPDRIATGHWTASGVQIPMAGNWAIAVTVRTSDIDQVTVDKNAQIG